MSTSDWSPFCRAHLSRADVRPLDPSSAQDWELELYELTDRRGLPRLLGTELGHDAASAAPVESGEGGAAREPFATSPSLGPLYIIAPSGPKSLRGLSTRSGLHLAQDWRDWIERLARVDAMAPFPPPLVVLNAKDQQAQRELLSRFIAKLGLSREPTSGDVSPIFAKEDTLVMGAYPHGGSRERVYTTNTGALDAALRAATEIGLPWCMATTRLPFGAIPAGLTDIVNEHRRATHFGALRVLVGKHAVVQQLEVLGIRIEDARFTPGGGVRRLDFVPPHGSERLARWARTGRVVRTSTQLDEASVAQWARERGITPWPALARCEQDLGGLLAPGGGGAGDADPLSRPAIVLGLGLLMRAPETLVASWSRAYQTSPDEPLLLSCGVEEPQVRRYLLWSWRGHDLVFIGEWRGRFVFCDAAGAIWRYDGLAGQLDVAAGTPRAFLERIALEEHLWSEWGHYVPVHVFADVGTETAHRLGLRVVREATDELVQTYEGDGVLLRQLAEYGPNRTEVLVAGLDAGRVVEAVRAARALAPNSKVKVFSETGQGAALVNALIEAGIGDRWSLTATELQEKLASEGDAPDGDA
ncbi:hypothetical protein BE20_19440 [Sorangium cellulosum]|uniref:Uncharacterized protein n=1 Tax=Sorangium cellulosum TaxID=56 RepID=A0A150SBF7_SORCE|nr:hypothetical protein BE18_04145 [Sorangium cellulosum]KYF89833.1 hypothetical protein BE20_19440 [Sorangium cellulosum]